MNTNIYANQNSNIIIKYKILPVTNLSNNNNVLSFVDNNYFGIEGIVYQVYNDGIYKGSTQSLSYTIMNMNDVG